MQIKAQEISEIIKKKISDFEKTVEVAEVLDATRVEALGRPTVEVEDGHRQLQRAPHLGRDGAALGRLEVQHDQRHMLGQQGGASGRVGDGLHRRQVEDADTLNGHVHPLADLGA